ncbi:MAG: DUF3892 domain-containing protein [Firmicutes bacterium]|nr:DUF3892 domain-containing protein [Bacillota bacterium]
MAKNVKAIQQTPSGKNTKFMNTTNGTVMNRTEFIRRIKSGPYENDYHIRNTKHGPVIASNPDKSKKDNLE